MNAELAGVEVLAFDTFGTVADWFTGISAAVARTVTGVDAADFTRRWRRRYSPIMAEVEAGTRPYAPLDDLQTETLREVAGELGLDLSPAQQALLVAAWHTIPAWPDSVAALHRLADRYILGPLSNGGTRLLVDMARADRFGWHFIGGSDVWRHYKPAPQTYLGVAALLDTEPRRVLMVACHQNDLDAARSHGLRTAFVARPTEWGPGAQHVPDAAAARNDVNATDLGDLADQLLGDR